MPELKRLTVGELKNIIKDLPDNILVLGLEDHRPTTEIFVKDNNSYFPHIRVEKKNHYFGEYSEDYEKEIMEDIEGDIFLLIDFS